MIPKQQEQADQRFSQRGLYAALVEMMTQDGKTPPPSIEAYRAAIDWWHAIDEDERELWQDGLGLEHVRDWWTRYPQWLERCQQVDPDLDHVVFAFCFEHATVTSDMGGMTWAKKKTYGELAAIRLITETDGYYLGYIAVEHNESSPWRQKWQQRNLLKDYLPPKLRTVINQSRSMTWQAFAAKCDGGWVRDSMTSFDDDTQHISQAIRHAIHQPDESRIVSIRTTEDGRSTTMIRETFTSADPRWRDASKRLCRQFGWTPKELWRHIGGKDLLPKAVIFDDGPLADASGRKQRELF